MEEDAWKTNKRVLTKDKVTHCLDIIQRTFSEDMSMEEDAWKTNKRTDERHHRLGSTEDKEGCMNY